MKLRSTIPVAAGFVCALIFAGAHAASQPIIPHGHFGAPKLSVTNNTATADNFDVVNHDTSASHAVQVAGLGSFTLEPNPDPSPQDPPSCVGCQYSAAVGFPISVQIDNGPWQSVSQSQTGPVTYVDIYPNSSNANAQNTNGKSNVHIVVH